MKKILSLLLCGLLALSCLTGCGAAPGEKSTAGNTLSAVVTIFPEYDWLRTLLGSRADKWDVTLLLDNGVDMHSYQPSAADIVKIATCDLFIYVGGESDAWVADALHQSDNPGRIVLNLMDLLGSAAVTEELVEGMEAAEEEDEPAYDEHVWLSLENARLFCAAIGEALTALESDGAADYAEILAAYDRSLADLDGAYRAAVEAAPLDTLLFGDRFPFRYLTDEYGLTYYAAFPGCSAETEASFETIAFLSGKLKELDLPAVLIPDGSDGRIADTIVRNGGASAAILTLDSMQSVPRDRAETLTYLSVMEQNLAVLKAALNP